MSNTYSTYAPLNLRISKDVKEAIKGYATANGRSISDIVENMLAALAGVRKMAVNSLEITPFVDGLNVSANVPASFSYEEEREKILLEKYGVTVS